ncbi:AarF/UbiB family protein [Bacillus thuringiensis]|uniref:AarF/UbiB family protein n=1 Tax=Bacillus thuringiensis TaxID=1428 RepID=UPI000E487851|nr:AarF/UbiB family protein [Bacillus thuringiensis]MDZ3952437.1 AarF/UbiB family protein [Bacillus thuringiensis]RGP45253.1 kinase [Bacillus thuringiensis]
MNKYFNKRKISRRDVVKYKLIGDGKDGEVYQLSCDKCVKIFFQEETQKKELRALVIGQSSPVIPRLYGYGENYIIMEYIQGISLACHLKKEKEITEELAERLLIMLDELKKIGFTRWDTEIRHVLINEEGQLKVIDHKRAFTSNKEVPTKLLKGFKKFGLSQDFLNYVKNKRTSVYNTWMEQR